MLQSRLVRRPWSAVLAVLLVVSGIVVITQRPASAVVIDGPPVIGQEPAVPQSHPGAGGGAVRIYGESLLGVNAVTIGGVALSATDFKVVDGDLIIAQVPAAGAGILDGNNDGYAHITVTDDEGSSTTDLDGDGAVDDQKCDACVGGELGAIFYTDATLTLGTSTNLDRTETTTVTLDGHRPGTRGLWAVPQLNPLVNFLEDAPADGDTFPPGPGYGDVMDFVVPDANGDADGVGGEFESGSNVQTITTSGSSPQFNDKDQDYDASADCPPSQTSADYGLDKCMVGYSEFGMGSLEKLISFGADAPDVDPTPAAPTLTLTGSSVAAGSALSISGINWNAAPHFGSDATQDDPGESDILIEVCNTALTTCNAAGSVAATVTPTRYFDSGTDPDFQPVTGVYSGATLSGSFTVPNPCSPCDRVRVRQQRYDIEANAPVASSYLDKDVAVALTGPFLAIDDVTVTEGNAGSATATFTVTRTGDVSGASTVDYSTANGTANSASDYTSIGTTGLSYTAGQTTKSVAVTVSGDATHEADETFNVNLTNLGGATPGDVSGTGTIRNDDGPSFVSIDDLTVIEGSAGTTTASFLVSRDGNTSATSSVNYASANGTATSGSDYTSASGTLNFAVGELSKTVSVTVTADTVNESNEDFTVTLSSPSGGTTISDSSATAKVVNDDAAASVTVNNVVVTEGNAGTTPAVFTVQRWGALGSTASVNYATSNGSASSASDYTATSGTLNFAAGDAAKTVTVNVNGDVAGESNETFTLTLTVPVGVTISDSSATGTIKSDEGTIAAVLPSISINDVSVLEGNISTTATFTVTRSGDTSGTSSVNYSTAGGTASGSGIDFTSIASTALNFAASEVSKQVAVTITADEAYENSGNVSEAFTLNLASPTGATLADTSGAGTIFSDDFVYLSISELALIEGTGGTTTANFLISRSGSLGSSTSVSYATATGTATAGTDYTTVAATPISFVADENLKLVTVNVTADAGAEGAETFLVNLSAVTTGHVLADSQATATIVNDD